MNLSVTSEIGNLRRVIVHRPGIEIARITPENKEALLFDDLLWVDRAQAEHDAFAGLMSERGAEVLYFEQLLADVLAEEAVREDVVSRVVTAAECGPYVAGRLTSALAERSPADVIDVLLGGLLERELPALGIDPLFADLISDRFRYVMRPVPNLLFMRDNAAWIDNGLVRSSLATPARRRESVFMAAIYNHHPLFRDEPFPTWFGDEPEHHFPASIEGGDVLVINERTLVIGLGERTTPAAVEMLAHRLFRASAVDQIVVVHLRHDRSVMHLDTVFTMVDHNKFNIFPSLLEGADVHVISKGNDARLAVEKLPDVGAAMRRVLDRDDLVMISTGGDHIGRLREQWDDGNNTLALAPGVVVAYSRNTETNRRLRDEGIEVLELDSSELCRGRGGSRCMTQPILRDAV